MPELEHLDHVAVLVADTEAALRYFRDELGLPVAHAEVLEELAVRLTFVDANNVFIQLLEPLAPDTPLARELSEHGEGLHHVCFGVQDPVAAACELAAGSEVTPGRGRGRVSVFVPGSRCGVRIELTESPR